MQRGPSEWTVTVEHVVTVCGRCLLPAGTPSCRGQRCCPSSAWWGPAGGGRDTFSPTAKGYSWAPLSWQPFSTATGPFLHPAGGRQGGREEGERGQRKPGCEVRAAVGEVRGWGGVKDFPSPMAELRGQRGHGECFSHLVPAPSGDEVDNIWAAITWEKSGPPCQP